MCDCPAPQGAPPAPPATAEPGVLPYIVRLWPDLTGRALAERAGVAFDVHFTTIYRWVRFGMASAEAQKMLDFQDLCARQLGVRPGGRQLCLPSNYLNVL